jgi:hypothetical protein
MNKFSTAVLLVLLAVAVAQDDIQVIGRSTGIGSASQLKVGGWREVDINSFQNSEEEQLVNEAVEQSRLVYERGDALNQKDALDKVISIQEQVVAGILYKITWSTSSGRRVRITVHQVPWQEAASERYPVLPDAIEMIKN